jgi:hypothetical protein
MKTIIATATLLLAAGEAGAASILTLEAMEARHGPSMIVLDAAPAGEARFDATPGARAQPLSGEPYAASAIIPLTPSIIAIGGLPVSMEEVAATGGERAGKPASARPPAPMVIRGGLVGEAFSRTPQPTAARAPAARAETAPPKGGRKPASVSEPASMHTPSPLPRSELR